MTSEPATAPASAPAVSGDSRRSMPDGAGFGVPGLTMARTRQPAIRNASAMCCPRNPVAPVRLTNRLFIETIGLVPVSAGGFYARVDQVVVFERPGQLGALIALCHRSFLEFGNEQWIDPALSIRRQHAEQQHADAVHDR